MERLVRIKAELPKERFVEGQSFQLMEKILTQAKASCMGNEPII